MLGGASRDHVDLAVLGGRGLAIELASAGERIGDQVTFVGEGLDRDLSRSTELTIG